MAKDYPYLYGNALDRMEDEPQGPVPIDVQEYSIGEDLMKGINDIDGARDVVTNSRQKVRKMQYSTELRTKLLAFI